MDHGGAGDQSPPEPDRSKNHPVQHTHIQIHVWNWDFMASGGRRDPIAQHWKLKQIAEWNTSGVTSAGTLQLFLVPATEEGC